MMSKLHSLFVRSAKGTRGQQSRPAFVQGINNIPNVLMSFGGWNAFKRMHRQTRSLLAVLLIGMFGLVLAGCGGDGDGGGGDDDPTTITRPDPFAVPKPLITEIASSGNNITVTWENPARENITGFKVSWVNADGGDEDSSPQLTNETDPAVNISSGASGNTYNIMDLEYDTAYIITVSVSYKGVADPVDSESVEWETEEEMSGDNHAVADADADGVADADDADYDGNGLIEIRTLDELSFLRYDLNGNGTDEDGMGDDMGCPDTGCIGYELMLSLNFSDAGSYADNTENSDWTDRSGSGWTPIGSCADVNNESLCFPYTGEFDGRGYSIADLFISVDNDVNSTGLFAAVSGGPIRNLHLLDADVRGGANSVGLLAGVGTGIFEDLSVSGSLISPSANLVGGLVGFGLGADIRASYASGVTVSGRTNVGGLVGGGLLSNISGSYASDVTVSGNENVGGLLGSTGLLVENVQVDHSYVSGLVVSGTGDHVGGLVGSGENANIFYSYADIESVSGNTNVGGLIGSGDDAKIFYSYAVNGTVAATHGDEDYIGGLIGGGSGIQINYSYAAVGTITGANFVDGLAGSVGVIDAVVVTASYWDVNTTGLSADENSKTTIELQEPERGTEDDRGFPGTIYETWASLQCDPDTGEVSSEVEPADRFSRNIWDLGTSDQYPALKCVVGGLEAQGR